MGRSVVDVPGDGGDFCDRSPGHASCAPQWTGYLEKSQHRELNILNCMQKGIQTQPDFAS